MFDLFFLIIGKNDWKAQRQFKLLKSKFPFAKSVVAEDAVTAHYLAAEEANTSFFFVLDAGFEIVDSFKLNFKPDKIDKNWVLRFKNSCHDNDHGLRLMHQSMFQIPVEEAKNSDFIYNFGSIGIKDLELIVVRPQNILLDIVFIDMGESFANKHYEILKSRHGDRVKRSSNVKGIWQAHCAAADVATTGIFYVVDADVIPRESFKFDFVPKVWDEEYVHVWNTFSALTRLSYGNGGIKLLNKSFFIEQQKEYVDMTTMISTQIAQGAKYLEETAADNHFNEDPFLAWRGAYRETVKLKSGILEGSISEENTTRLEAWLNLDMSCANSDYAANGVLSGLEHVHKKRDIKLINDYGWLKENYANAEW